MNNGGPAFPMWTNDMPIVGSEGITVRDYFAIHAPEPSDEAVRMETTKDKFADAMLAAREKS